MGSGVSGPEDLDKRHIFYEREVEWSVHSGQSMLVSRLTEENDRKGGGWFKLDFIHLFWRLEKAFSFILVLAGFSHRIILGWASDWDCPWGQSKKESVH